MLAENHSNMRANTWFADAERSIKLPIEIITLVSWANSIGSAREFICNGRSFIYTNNCRGPNMDPWGTPCFNIPQSEAQL